jgi:hypothetical protein
MHHISRLTLVILIISVILAPATAAKACRDTTHPVVFSTDTTSPHPGDTVNCTVTLDQTTSSDLSLAIGASDGSLFVLPDTVTVPAGNSQVSFSVTVKRTASGSATLSATANGGTATSSTIAITP